eukprot:4387507-Pyramimonas_sp.AAC.1
MQTNLPQVWVVPVPPTHQPTGIPGQLLMTIYNDLADGPHRPRRTDAASSGGGSSTLANAL